MTTKTYDVHRPMQDGARSYAPGDTRDLTEADAADLVALGALSLKGHDPVEREPAVVHTFGERPSEYTSYTSASGEPVGSEIVTAKPVTVERKPGKSKA